jgi:hypothetical protein
MTASIVTTDRRGFWTWPGPGRLYEFLLVAAVYLPFLHFFRKSGFAMAAITALTICVTYISAPLRTDMSAEDWSTLNRYTIWVMRAAALAVGYWLFSDTPTMIGRYSAVLAYAVLYVICENAAWRRKRTIEKAA